MFVTITDSEENSSRKYSISRLKKLVFELEAAGWTFVFLSGGLDAYGEAGCLGVKSSYTQSFQGDKVGTKVMPGCRSQEKGKGLRACISQNPVTPMLNNSHIYNKDPAGSLAGNS